MRGSGLLVLAVLCFPLVGANADTIVAPNANETVEGNDGNSFPFNNFDGRYQQAYAASEFPSLLPGEALSISQIAFRTDAHPAAATWLSNLDLDIHLSTSANPVGSLSLTFADNVGTDDSLVLSATGLSIGGTQGGAPGPNAFDVIFTLDSPFLYDPAAGDLLMDVFIFGRTNVLPVAGFSYLDAAESTTGSFDVGLQRVWHSTDVNSATGGTDLHGFGLVTQFEFEVVPEPGTGLLVALGLLGLAGRRPNR